MTRRPSSAGDARAAVKAIALAKADLVRTAHVLQQWIRDRREYAAILLLSLGEQTASEIFVRLPPDEVALLAATVLDVAVVERRRLSQVAHAFIAAVGGLSVLTPDPTRFLRDALTGAFGERVSQRVQAAVLAASKASTSAILRALPDEVLAAILGQEHPQVGAAILAQLVPERALAACRFLAPDVALELTSRLTRLRFRSITPEALADLHAGICEKLRSGDWGQAITSVESEVANVIAEGLHPDGLPSAWLDAVRP